VYIIANVPQVMTAFTRITHPPSKKGFED